MFACDCGRLLDCLLVYSCFSCLIWLWFGCWCLFVVCGLLCAAVVVICCLFDCVVFV